ncbi:hypothetical protein [Thauera butanivorans]|uniref:hypothetical protein n=1 Tax=Thauera butanivorans TaxID=86174 RepID=UPI0012F82FD6|nr:hypothetical protein [Thauera butanivorans]
MSLLLSVAITLWVASGQLLTFLPESEVRSAVGIGAQISATMLGFLIAAMSILASISGHRLLRNMQRTGHYRVLLRRLFWNASAYGVSMALAVGGVVLKGAWFDWVALLTLSCFIFSTLLLVDIAWRFWLVLSNISPE